MACEKCKGTGLISHPTIPFAYLDCDCQEMIPEKFYKLNPDDFDFPCSDTFRAFYGNEQGSPLPAADMEDRIDNLEAISSESGRVPRRYEGRLEQIQGQVLYLQNKLNEQTLKRKGIKRDSF